ncbi:MAG: SH3 domain-containing protein [Actinomycetota bacterium]|nr:SH3 domain-containing protein [Actinomycetota bacterium]
MGASTTVACGLSYPDKDKHGWVNFPANTVTLRSGPSNGCIATGQGLPDQRADYLCYTPGDGGTWTYLRNTATGDQGWVRDDLLPHYGSDKPCEDNPPPASVRG